MAYGGGLYGEEYYGATVVDGTDVDTIQASSTTTLGLIIRVGSMLLTAVATSAMTLATRLRTASWAALAAAAITVQGRLFWEPDAPDSEQWFPFSPTPDPWTESPAGSGTWTQEQ